MSTAPGTASEVPGPGTRTCGPRAGGRRRAPFRVPSPDLAFQPYRLILSHPYRPYRLKKTIHTGIHTGWVPVTVLSVVNTGTNRSHLHDQRIFSAALRAAGFLNGTGDGTGVYLIGRLATPAAAAAAAAKGTLHHESRNKLAIELWRS